MGNEESISLPGSLRNSEKCSEAEEGFIRVKAESILIYTCHLFDVCPAFPALPNLVSKKECLTVKVQATFQAHESFKISLKALSAQSLNFVVVVVFLF